ncbi:MAG: hypothetical protein AAGE90_10755 [Pseudomonadota bacterium]
MNPIRALFQPLLLGPAVMALGGWGVWHAYTVAIPREVAYARQGEEVEARVIARRTAPTWPLPTDFPAEYAQYGFEDHLVTATFEGADGTVDVTSMVVESFYNRVAEGDPVRVLHVAEQGLARIDDGQPPSPKLTLMGAAVLACLGFGLTLIGLVGRLL